MQRTYAVKIRIKGYAKISVTADSEDEAIGKALDEVELDDMDDWEPDDSSVEAVCEEAEYDAAGR